ncbi:tyrosine-type recombinase/integrase [candidate division KSB1 bacterium]|nr:tyrosine-type recombinase/integrase [candidate division KSB1 bacterium]
MEHWLRRFDRYLQVERHGSIYTRKAYINDIGQFILYVQQRLSQSQANLNSFTRATLRGFLAHLVRSGYTPRTVARKLATLRSFARYLVRESAIIANPTLNITSPKLPKRLPHFLTRHEMQSLLALPAVDTFSGLRDRLILYLFYTTGVRISEAANLQVQDIQFWDGTLRVKGKRDKVRLLPMGRGLTQLLQNYLDLRRSQVIKSTRSAEFVFVDDRGEPYTRQQLARLIQGYIRRIADPKKAHPHALRHSFATHLIDEGANIMSVKELLGHASLSTTQIYTHVSAEHLRRIYKQAHPRAGKNK